AAGREKPGVLVLLIGNRGTEKDGAKSVYAQRKGDGGVERVEGGPLDELLAGPQQFFRRTVAEWNPGWMTKIARDSGLSPEGAQRGSQYLCRGDACVARADRERLRPGRRRRRPYGTPARHSAPHDLSPPPRKVGSMPLDAFFDRLRKAPDLGPNVVRWHREP